MLKQLRNRVTRSDRTGQGFTIIEVMIVLAIAGLIILIVLLAVPALQRNGRNTAIKNDASAITGAISEYKSNNDGKIPADLAQTDARVTLGAATDNQSDAKVQPGTDVTAADDYPTESGEVHVAFRFKCPENLGDAPVASNRSVAVLYSTESSGGNIARQCIDS